MAITIKKLTQEKANSLIENLSGEPLENFKLAFHDEKENLLMHKIPIALPQEDRIYYSITVDDVDYLLVGINLKNTNAINISSYARITTNLKGKASNCLKNLIDIELVPMCQSLKKERIISYAYTIRSKKVFEKLLTLRIKDIRDIKFNGNTISIIILPATDG
jgi:hypothetical protein